MAMLCCVLGGTYRKHERPSRVFPKGYLGQQLLNRKNTSKNESKRGKIQGVNMIKSQKLFSFHWQEESTQGQHRGRYGRRDEDRKKMSTSLVILSMFFTLEAMASSLFLQLAVFVKHEVRRSVLSSCPHRQAGRRRL